MVRLLFMFLVLFCISEYGQAAPAPVKGYTAIDTTPDPQANQKYAKGTVFTPETNYVLNGVASDWLYVEIVSTDAGNNYYWGDAAQAFLGNGWVYFGSCNPLPPGNYECTVFSLNFPQSQTIPFIVSP